MLEAEVFVWHFINDQHECLATARANPDWSGIALRIHRDLTPEDLTEFSTWVVALRAKYVRAREMHYRNFSKKMDTSDYHDSVWYE